MRGVILFLLGVFYMGGVANGFSNVYFAGVLQRIGVAYLFAGLLFIFFRPRTLATITGTLLIAYWALLTFVPVPGIGHASYEHGRNLAYWIDQHYLPGQKFEGTILSTLAAVANCLLGIFAGLILKDSTRSELAKVRACHFRVRVAAGRVSLVISVSNYQAAVDFQLRPRRVRHRRDSSLPVPLDYRSAQLPHLVPAFHLDRFQRDHDLSRFCHREFS